MRPEPSEEAEQYCDKLKSLREDGQLQEAYHLGKQLHERYPQNECIEGTFAWVIYDCLKRYRDEKSKFHKDLSTFLKTLNTIPSYGFDADANDLFYANIATYLIPPIGWDLRDTKNISSLKSLLECLEELDAHEDSCVYRTMIANLEKPISALGWDYRKENNVDGLVSLLHTVTSLNNSGTCFRNKNILIMFLKGFEPPKGRTDTPTVQLKKAEGIVELVEWFGLENLTHDMFQKEEYQGNLQDSLAEKLVKRYIDALARQNYDEQFIFTKNRIRTGLDALSNVLQSESAAQWIWPHYSYGKLLMLMDGEQKARPYLAKVLIDKWDEPYIWGAFADTFANENLDAYAKCLFRALRLSKSIQYELGLHEKAMLYLKSVQNLPAAKREAIIVSEYRKSQGWSESKVVESQKNEEWFAVEPTDDNTDLYREMSVDAEKYVFPYAEKTNFYVEWKNGDKGLIGIVSEGTERPRSNSPASARRNLFFVPSWAQGLRRTVIKDYEAIPGLKIGSCYTGILSKDGRTILGDINECVSNDFKERFEIEFQGTLDLIQSKDKLGNDKIFGFVRDTKRGSLYVPPTLLNDSSLDTFDIVKGCARAHVKDEQWEMEVTHIELIRKPQRKEIERIITGTFESTRQPFGFVDDCFIPRSLVNAGDLKESDDITVRAIKSWDKKKGCWGWTAIEIIYKESY